MVRGIRGIRAVAKFSIVTARNDKGVRCQRQKWPMWPEVKVEVIKFPLSGEHPVIVFLSERRRSRFCKRLYRRGSQEVIVAP